MHKVFLPCSGLGHVCRGYESFSRECFDVISSSSPEFEITLFKGGGEANHNEIRLFNLPRERWLSLQVSKFVGLLTGNGGSYFTEQLSFFLSFLPHVFIKKPDIIYLSDEGLANLLWYWRYWTGQRYKLLFSNGGPTSNMLNTLRWDYIHQLAYPHLKAASAVGFPEDRQSMIPGGIYISPELKILDQEQKQQLRCKLDLPKNRKVILTVAAINKSHKRIDYLVREIAKLENPRPYLVMLGQKNRESLEIIQLSSKLLGENNFQIRTIPREQISDYYSTSDMFILPSLREGLPRVLAEALSYGLPCLAHDYEIARFALGEEGFFEDFKLEGSLSSLITRVLQEPDSVANKIRRHHYAYNNFSWDILGSKYIEMIQKCTA